MTTTTNLGLTKPTVGGSANTWGTTLNDNLDSVDAIFASAGNGTSVGLQVGSGKTLDVSAGTLTLADNQISGDKVEGGTIAAITITSLTATALSSSSVNIDGGAIDGTPIGASSVSTGAFSTISSSGAATLSSLSTSSADINGGAIDGTPIGASSASTVGATTVTATTVSATTMNGTNITGSSTVNGGELQINGTNVLAKVYPVGSIYINASNSTNPSSLLGFGTWVAFGTGRVMVGIDASQSEFNTIGETGGVKEVTLTAAQSGLPAHTHFLQFYSFSDPGDGGGAATGNDSRTNTSNQEQLGTNAISAQDASQAHTNLQPYITVYMWKRTL